MSSRQAEKERRRAERAAAEAAERKAAERRRRLQLLFGGLLVVAAATTVVLALVVGVFGDDESPGAPERLTDSAETAPTANIANLDQAVSQGNCELKKGLPIEGESHDDKDFKGADYKTNPPTSGDHNPNWAQDGIYEAGNESRLGELVHTLEHGRIDVQYKKGTAVKVIRQLEGLLGEKGGYHQLLFQNPTEMPYAVAATAWGQLLGCKTVTPAAFDAIRKFRDAYTDKGPENVP